jgi:hypothetical protein
MKRLGIDVGLRGATCTLSKTSPMLETDTAAWADSRSLFSST